MLLNIMEMYYLIKIIFEINHFMMFYAPHKKMHNFGTCKHHGKTFVCETNYFM
jgi:hypothetical protein